MRFEVLVAGGSAGVNSTVLVPAGSQSAPKMKIAAALRAMAGALNLR